ncbi:hypothetical protein LSH36_1395g00066 [Paralvinella palmiformis]|uniref:Syndetin n=1 Tax=Paralvinella palmiformis TaxID=53620 RepID=A0AAD9ITA7_9ANNE|nr:hypothetical protein LSH36_1395g00066 [Paralvinella palmiformis]
MDRNSSNDSFMAKMSFFVFGRLSSKFKTTKADRGDDEIVHKVDAGQESAAGSRTPDDDFLPTQLAISPAVAKYKKHLNHDIPFDPQVDRDLIDSVDEMYYEDKSIDPGLHEIKKLADDLDLKRIDEGANKLHRQLQAVSRKVSELVLEKDPAYVAELHRVIELQENLTTAATVCHNSRRKLNDAKQNFTTASLGLLANYRKRQQLIALLKSLKTIKTLEEDYPGAIQLCLECQKAARSFKHYKCISELSSKLQDTLEMIEESLDVALSKTCNGFDEKHYEKVQVAYRLLDGSTSNIEVTLNRRYIRQKLDHGLGRIWADIEQKVKIYLLSTDLSHFKYDEFIHVLDVVNRLIQIGEEFCGSKSETLQDSLRKQSVNYMRNYHSGGVKMDPFPLQFTDDSKYMQMMTVLKPIAFDVIICMSQLFDYYLYAVYKFFATDSEMLEENERSLSSKLRTTLKRIHDNLIVNEFSHPGSPPDNRHNKELEKFSSCLEIISRKVPIPKAVSAVIWKHCIRLSNKTFVEGFSCAKKCTNEGRALMQLDFQQFLMKLEKLTDLRPIPDREYVEAYVKAYYLPESQLESWIREHKEYSNKQLTGLVNCLAHLNKKSRQRLLTLIEETDRSRHS